jgi:hypothetical protein
LVEVEWAGPECWAVVRWPAPPPWRARLPSSHAGSADGATGARTGETIARTAARTGGASGERGSDSRRAQMDEASAEILDGAHVTPVSGIPMSS